MKLPRATWAVVAIAVAGGVLALLTSLLRHPDPLRVTEDQWIVCITMGLLALASHIWPVVVFHGGESEAFNMDEGLFVILALLVPPELTIGILGLAAVVAQCERRRPAVQSAFNVGQVLIASGLGLVVSRSLALPSNPLTIGEIAAILFGTVIYVVVQSLLIDGLMASMGAGWSEALNGRQIQLSLAGAGALLGVILALAIQQHVWAVSLAVPVVVLERRLITARFGALYDRARMEGLFEVTLSANRGLQQQEVIDTIVTSARQLLRSPQADLTVAQPDGDELAAPMLVAGQPQWL